MAIFLKGINGAYSGKVGNIVGSTWRGIDYIRSLPKKSTKPSSEAQIAHRAKFSLAVSFLSAIKEVVNIGYSDLTLKRVTGYNLAVKLLMTTVIVGTYPNFSIDYSKLIISKGGQASLTSLTFTQSAPLEVTIGWLFEENRFNSFGDDTVIVLLYNVENMTFRVTDEVLRNAEQCMSKKAC